MGYTLDYPEPSAAFTVLENAEGKAKTRWDCPAYLELCNKMRSDIAGQEREDLYKDMEALLAQECPVMPIYNYVATALVSERVKGFTRNANGPPEPRVLHHRRIIAHPFRTQGIRSASSVCRQKYTNTPET